MRVRSGRFKGRELAYPRAGLRPTKDITRQAIFNILADRIAGASVLDLFAGGGSLGLEALSRGAARAVFVERDAATLRCLRANLAGIAEAETVRGSLPGALARLEGQEFDVVIADPPYRKGLVGESVAAVAARGLVAPGGVLVVEHAAAEPPAAPEGWSVLKQAKYGDTLVTIIRRPE
jgi:16S rRNA (guanine966-N2)-methyltransferase